MAHEEGVVIKEVESIFKKVASLPEDSINAIIKRIIDNLIELRIQHPSVEFFGDKVKQSYSFPEYELDVNKCLPFDGSSPVFEDIGEVKEVSIIIQKEVSEVTASSYKLPKMHNVTSHCYFAVPLKNKGSGKCGDQNGKRNKVPSCDILQSHQLSAAGCFGSSNLILCKKFGSEDTVLKTSVSKDSAISEGSLSSQEPEARPHIRTRKPKFFCDNCNYSTNNKLMLKRHVHKHLRNGDYKCTICKRNFRLSSCLKVHMKRHRNQRDFPCGTCEYKAFTKTEKKLHMLVHSGEKNQVCHYCGKAFRKKSTLKEHIRSIHERSSKQQCPQCDFTTYHSNSLKVHIKLRHQGELNNYVCPVCGGKVKLRNAFLEHMQSHTGEKPFSCDKCKSSFACAGRLKAHMKSVHAPRSFHCAHCSKVFQTKHHMLRHETVHTHVKPFGCPFCSYMCNTQGNLTKHVRLIHSVKEFSFRKRKADQESVKDIKEEWITKGHKFTEEYLKSLSEKLGRDVTVEELRLKEDEKTKNQLIKAQKTKLQSSKRTETQEHSYFSSKQTALPKDAECEVANDMAVLLPTPTPPSTVLVQLPNSNISDSTTVSEMNSQFTNSHGQVLQVLQSIDSTALSNAEFIQVEPVDNFSQSPLLTDDVCSFLSTGTKSNNNIADQEVYQLVSGNPMQVHVNGYGDLEENAEEFGVQIHLEEILSVNNKENINILGADIMDPMSYLNVEVNKTDSENTVLVIINTDGKTAQS